MVGLNQNRKRAWADLPPKLISSIMDLLTSNPVTVLSFRSVCSSWRSSCPRLAHTSLLSPHLPISVFNKHSRLRTTVIYAMSRPLKLSQAEFPLLTPPSWILFLQEFQPGKICICKPLSGKVYKSYNLPLTFPKAISPVRFNAHELSRFYNVGHKKAVLFPNGLDAVLLLDEARQLNFREGKLGIIRLGVENSNLEIIHDGGGFKFDDIIEFKGRVLGIDRRATVYEIGCRSSDIKQVFPGLRGGGGGRRKRLVESLGLLYLVVRCNSNSGYAKKFEVCELDEKKGKWAEITSLGDRSFFFGLDCSFSASSRDLGLCGKNCILFKLQSFSPYDLKDEDYTILANQSGEGKDYRWRDSESYDLFDIGVCHLHDDIRFGAIKSYPSYLDTLWPPPSWIWPIGRMKRLKKIEARIDRILTRIPPNIQTMFERSVKRVRSWNEEREELLHQHGGLENWEEIQKLRSVLNRQKLTEQNFSLLQEHAALTATLTELQKKESFVSAQTLASSLVKEEEHNHVDEMMAMKRSIKRLRTEHDSLLKTIRDKFAEKNAQMFVTEANATELVRHYKTFPLSPRFVKGEGSNTS